MQDLEEMIQFKKFLKDKDNEQKMSQHDKYIKEQAELEQKKKEKEDKWYQYYRNFDNDLS